MKRINKTLLVTLLAASAAPALAADSLDIKVIGTITPAACVPTASGSGTFDYGIIKASTLSADKFNVQQPLTQTLTITCDAPVKMALNFQDAKSDSTVIPVGAEMESPTGVGMTASATTKVFNGLGMAGNAKIGGYTLSIPQTSIKVDGNTPVDVVVSTDKETWRSGASWLGNLDYPYIAYSAKGASEPLAFTTLTGNLVAQAAINKASALDLTKDITLDGQGTLQIIYL